MLKNLKPAAKIGRKQGSTVAAKQQSEQQFMEMKNEIVLGWAITENRPANCTLDEWIKRNQVKYGFDTGKPEHSVTKAVVWSRMKRGKLKSKGTGRLAPLAAIEPRIVMFIKLSSKCNQEMTKDEIIEFVNSYIEGSDLEKDYIIWKIMNHTDWRNNYIASKVIPVRAQVGNGWFQGFVKRWSDEIGYSKTTNTAHYRKEHCAYDHFVTMYERVYQLMEEDGYAEKLPTPAFFDKMGNGCEEEEAFGKIVDKALLRPDLIFVADECVTNTNMANDRTYGGNKRCHAKGASVSLPGCTSATHFTTMGFTTLNGEPVLCVIVIQKGSKLNLAERFGFDSNATWYGDIAVFEKIKDSKDEDGKITIEEGAIPSDLLTANMGPGKAFPGGPTCEFNGNEIPAFVTHSESGGITSEILVEVLEHLDHHKAASRNEGDPPPCLILDGHSSRLSISFLRYIRNLDKNGDEIPGSNHRWNAYLGLPPIGTAYWQVGDSFQQNGWFKSLIRREKDMIRNEQRDNGEAIKIKIERCHVVLMIRRVWPHCYGDVAGNKNAILERGWAPLNRGCLVNKNIALTKPHGY